MKLDKNAVVEDVVIADPDVILSDAEREELEELRAERDQRIAAKRAAEEIEKKGLLSVTLNLPPAAGKGITLAGREYLHGRTYVVNNDVKWAIEEAERRCWAHESSLHESENKGRKQRRAYVNA
ncbi:MAG: hypothetical protein V4621_08050 [Pseudomonadota bacterium]